MQTEPNSTTEYLAKLHRHFDDAHRASRMTPAMPAVHEAIARLSLWSEAAHSVKIENQNGDLAQLAIIATTRGNRTVTEQMQAAANASRGLAYITSIYGAHAIAPPPATDAESVQDLHHIAMNKLLPPEKLGVWRQYPASVRNEHGTILMTGAAPEDLDTQMKAWSTRHEAASGIHPLTAIANAHAEFERIHPFSDGNGRTGRLIISAMALERGLPLMPISKILEQPKDTYVKTLRAADAGQPQDWQVFFAQAAIHALRYQSQLVPHMTQFINATSKIAEAYMPPAKALDLALELAGQPVFNTDIIEKRLKLPKSKLAPTIAALEHAKHIGRSEHSADRFAIAPLTLAAKPYIPATRLQQEQIPTHVR